MAPPDASEPPDPRRLIEERVERALGRLLQFGVLTAATVVLAGGVAYLVRDGGGHPDYRRFAGEPGDLRSLAGVLRAALALEPRGIIQFGLILLVLTPVMRVAFSLAAFVRERDRTYMALTAFVLLVLIVSLLGLTP